MPVCKGCRNYVFQFPCPHCGSQESYTDRSVNEIKPIIPLELQKKFKEPPPPIQTNENKSTGISDISIMNEKPRFSSAPVTEEIHSMTTLGNFKENQKRMDISSVKLNRIKDSRGKSTLRTSAQEITIVNDVFQNRLENLELNLKILETNIQTLLKSQERFEGILLNIQEKVQKK